MYGNLKVHPVADIFPLLDDKEFERLVADIKLNGLCEPILLTSDGSTIVDGRNRYRACTSANVEPTFARLDDSSEAAIIALILSKNIKRRHLSVGQLGMLSFDLLPFLEKQTTGNVRDYVSEIVGVSGTAFTEAKRVAETDTKLANQVRSGAVALREAYKRIRFKPRLPKYTFGKHGPTIELRTHTGRSVPYPASKTKPTFNVTNHAVSWARFTWNPVTGCLHGCKYCYAREIAVRSQVYPVGFTPLFHHERLNCPRDTEVPQAAKTDPRWKRVFVCSMADLYGKWVPQQWIDQVHASCLANPQWEYLFLTKFPQRYVGLELPKTAWIGTSVDEQKRVRLAEKAFREIKDVRVKWLSLEPLLAPLEFTDLSMFDWIVIGSQTATSQPDGDVAEFAPPFEWVSRLVAQAREAGCRVYLKPNLLGRCSSQSPGMALPQEEPFDVNGKSSASETEFALTA